MLPQKFSAELNFDGRVAVVTGAASGIGFAVARLFSEKGATVCILDINTEKLQAASEQIPRSSAFQVDITDNKSIDQAVERIMKKYGKIDILVNSAGIGPVEWAEFISEEDWYANINVNLHGTFFMSQRVGKEMIKAGTGGKIVNLASQAGIVAIDQHVAYSASKAAVISVTKSLANEWAKYGIRVNAVSPTVTETPMIQAYWKGEVKEKALQSIPAARFAQPEEIAGAILFLASDLSSMVTGANLVVDGGYTIR